MLHISPYGPDLNGKDQNTQFDLDAAQVPPASRQMLNTYYWLG